MRAYIITDNNMQVNTAFSDKKELLKILANHIDELESDEKVCAALEQGGSFSITVEIADISQDEFDKINQQL